MFAFYSINSINSINPTNSMNEFLFNSFGRLRSGWRFVIYFFSFLVVSTIFTELVKFLTAGSGNAEINFFIIGNFVTFVIALLLGWGSGKLLEDLPFKALGASFEKNWLKDLFFGIGIGTLTILLSCLIAMIFGGMSFQINQAPDFNAKIYTLIFSFIVFVIGAANEEMIFRGYFLQTFTRAHLAWLAIILNSIIFGSAHLGNPNVSYFAIINTILAGIWFSVAYLKTRNLWFPFGLHFIWNWVQGAFLGIPVSGIREITAFPLLQQIDQGPTWLTGGHYGIEGGFACTIALAVSTILIWFLPILKPTEEMLALTNQENPKKTLA